MFLVRCCNEWAVFFFSVFQMNALPTRWAIIEEFRNVYETNSINSLVSAILNNRASFILVSKSMFEVSWENC